jgi:hypothetical protein
MTLRSSLPSRFLPAFVSLLFAGCGGMGGPEDGPPAASAFVALTSSADVDGYVTSAGDVSTGSVIGIPLGDNSFNDVARGFLRFHLAGIPAGSTVLSAVLRVHQGDVTGLPYATLGSLRVDHLDLGAGLDAGDDAAAALTSNIGAISVDSGIELKSIDVTAQVAADLAAGRTTSDYRLRFLFGTDFDGASDYVQVNDAEDHLGSGSVPLLLVTFVAP